MTAFVALAVIGHHDGRLTPNKTKIFGGKNLVGGFRTPRWPITAKQDKNFWGKKFSWRFSDTTMAYYRQSRQKYFVKFFLQNIFFLHNFFFSLFFLQKIFAYRYFFTFYFLFCWRFSDTIIHYSAW